MRAAVGLGANLDDAPGNVHEAIRRLGAIARVSARSDLYRSKPWGVLDQPHFYNAAALLETALEAPALLAALQELERALGRVPGERWGPRAIDLDLLDYAGMRWESEALTLPHPRLHVRAFALAPLCELDDAFCAHYAALPPEARADAVRIPRSQGAGLPPRTDYDREARHYDAARGAVGSAADPFVVAVAGALDLQPGADLLDLGCGSGRFAVVFERDFGARVTGIDASAGMLEHARRKSATIRWVHARLPDGLPAQFSAACAIASLHHLDAGERETLFGRLAAAGAPLAIVTFDHRYFVEHPLAQDFPSFLDIELARFPPIARLSAELTQAGFTNVRARDLPFGSGTSSYTRAIERVRQGYVSTFAIMDPGDVEYGLERMAQHARAGRPWRFDARATLVTASG